MTCELVRTKTSDSLILSGLFAEGELNNPVVLYLHGFEGDFFSHTWISMIGEELQKNGVGFLTVQTRGTAMHQELITADGEGFYCGAHYEKLEDASKDIDGWIEFLKSRGFNQVILSGHSLGTIKASRYLFEGENVKHIKKLLLLCPFDKNWLLEHAAVEVGKSMDELVAAAIEKVAEGKGDEIAPYGFDDVPHTYTNFLSWYNSDAIGKMFDFYNKNHDFHALQEISVPTKIVVGDKDEFFHPSNPEHPEEAMQIIVNNIPDCEGAMISGAKHSFRGFETELVSEVLEFAAK